MLFLKEWERTKATPNLVYSRLFPNDSFFVEVFRLSICYKRGFTDDATLTKLSFRENLLKDMKETSMIHSKVTNISSKGSKNHQNFANNKEENCRHHNYPDDVIIGPYFLKHHFRLLTCHVS